MKDYDGIKRFLLIIIPFLLFFISAISTCKPEEKGYSQSYETPKSDILKYPGTLSAIAYSKQTPSLIILDGEFVAENDIINGFKIEKIYPNKVELVKDGKVWTATISQNTSSIKREISRPIQGSNYLNLYRSAYPLNYNYSRYYTNNRTSIAENGSYYGEISKNTGRPKTVYVNGYFRKDGTYVRSHYRSRPRR
jgi:hypothetical protein